MQLASAGLRDHVIEKEPRVVKNEVTVNATESRREIGDARRSIVDVNSSYDPRPVERAFKRSIDLRGSGNAKSWRNSGKQPEIESAIQSQAHVAPLGKADAPVQANVCIRSAKLCRLDLEAVLRRPKMHRPDILELHVGIGEKKSRELGVDDHALWVLERSVQGDFAVGLAVPVKLLQVQCAQREWVQTHILDGNLPVDGVWLSERQGIAAGDFSRAHGRTQLQSRGASIGFERAIETSDHRLSNA